ncbi:MAG: HAMP domain-containing histidine kinase, partial [Planctomycetales bacterium]|nr:HAMP domain-containing histidine kinase [Planctomycetales bacterium]
YGASHEINNPLANIAARAQTLLAGEAEPGKRKMLEAIHRQAMRAHEMISDLMLFARPPRLEKAGFDIRLSIERVLEELRPFAEERSIQLNLNETSLPLTVVADRVQVEVALKSVIQNSIDAIGQGGVVLVDAERRTGQAAITVRDTGPGIPLGVREHIFDPFFSGREAGRGLGFGLSKCWRIVTEHGGSIHVESPPTGGAIFTLKLPIG